MSNNRIIDEFKVRKAYLEREIENLNKKLQSAPEGRLQIIQRNNKYYFYHVLGGANNRKQIFISKNNIAEAQNLALKKYNKQKLYEYENELKGIDSYIKYAGGKNISEEMIRDNGALSMLIRYGTVDKNINEIDKKEIANKYININEIDKKEIANKYNNNKVFTPNEIAKWTKEPFLSNPNHMENLNIKVTPELYVRSKSEAIIATKLIEYGIPFRYECGIILDDLQIFPDFTIISPRDYKIYIWEHLGMVDNNDYFRKNTNKIWRYIECGYIPTYNLILSYETKDFILDVNYVQKLIENYFL
ncbi:MAG: hypothetical protein K6A23_09875 [Butyrivibrio sp.]|nr:hypothetical protein [Butyrivibrio sp.]